MNKIDEAWALVKALPAEQQEIAADAILDFASRDAQLCLDDEQMAELRHRLDDSDPKSIPLDEARIRLRKHMS